MIDLSLGKKIHHHKRGTVYRVIGRVEQEAMFAHREQVYFVVCGNRWDASFRVMSEAEFKDHEGDAFVLPTMAQVSVKRVRALITWVIYQSLSDNQPGKVFIRPEDEFQGRFVTRDR